MDINPDDETLYTTQYQEAFLKYVENENWAKQRGLPCMEPESILSNNHFSSAMASRSGHSFYDPYDLSSNDDEYLMPKSVAEMMLGQSNCAAHLLTAIRLNSNSPRGLQQNWGQVNPILNEYHSNHVEISSTFWIPDITDWWCQQEATHRQ